MSSTRPPKRPFQPSITSYFPTSPPTPTPPQEPSRKNPLPPTIQSSLLHVGMRIRKAVPEGYKTATCKPIPTTTTSPQKRAGELMPYCAILDVGGLVKKEEVPDVEDLPPLQFDDFDGTSSQDSTSSNAAAAAPDPCARASGAKRGRGEDGDVVGPTDGDGEAEDGGNGLVWGKCASTLRFEGERPMARMRSSTRREMDVRDGFEEMGGRGCLRDWE